MNDEIIKAETRWDTGCPVMDSALNALEDLQDHIDGVTPHLEDHPAQYLLVHLACDLAVADDLLWGPDADDLNFRVALLERMLAVDPLPTRNSLTKKMIAGLTRAAKVATTRLQAYQGVVA